MPKWESHFICVLQSVLFLWIATVLADCVRVSEFLKRHMKRERYIFKTKVKTHRDKAAGFKFHENAWQLIYLSKNFWCKLIFLSNKTECSKCASSQRKSIGFNHSFVKSGICILKTKRRKHKNAVRFQFHRVYTRKYVVLYDADFDLSVVNIGRWAHIYNSTNELSQPAIFMCTAICCELASNLIVCARLTLYKNGCDFERE